MSDLQWNLFLAALKDYLSYRVHNFQAGGTQNCVQVWQSLTKDPFILNTVSNGYAIEFDNTPFQSRGPKEIHFSPQEDQDMDFEVKELIRTGVVETSPPQEGEFVSNVFLRPKPDGTSRVILNLKHLNDDVSYHHFKMASLQHALDLLTQGDYMAVIDWKFAYFSCPVDIAYRKFLTFFWKGTRLCFTCLPNGLSSAPRIFTKITKPIFAVLRRKGHMNVPYIDDIFLASRTLVSCRQNVVDTVELSLDTGFVVHPGKSSLEPSQSVTFVGFVINSRLMEVKLTTKKALKLKKAATAVLELTSVPILQVSQLTGMMVAAFPGVLFGPLFYRRLDNEKNRALRNAKGNYDTHMCISAQSNTDLRWWTDNIETTSKPIHQSKPHIVIQSDASLSAWGGVRGATRTGGEWSAAESTWHIINKLLGDIGSPICSPKSVYSGEWCAYSNTGG